MSETTEQATEELFAPEEIKQFDADDAEAGQAIGKMLSLLFLYTVFAMTVSAIATYYWVTATPAS